MATDDGQAVRRVLAGHTEAFRVLVERHSPRVSALAFGMLRHRQDAEDVVQETFLRAYRSLGSYDGRRPLIAWLVAIAVNCCRTQYKRRQRLPALIEGIEDIPARREGTSTSELAEGLAEAVGELREEYRAVFLLYHNQHLSYDEIAAALDRPSGTVKTWLHRARQELLEKLQRRGLVEAEEPHGLRNGT